MSRIRMNYVFLQYQCCFEHVFFLNGAREIQLLRVKNHIVVVADIFSLFDYSWIFKTTFLGCGVFKLLLLFVCSSTAVVYIPQSHCFNCHATSSLLAIVISAKSRNHAPAELSARVVGQHCRMFLCRLVVAMINT